MSLIEHSMNKLKMDAGEAEPANSAPRGLVCDFKLPAQPEAGSSPAASSRRIVQVDRTALIRSGFLPPAHKQRQIDNQFRHVKRPLLAAALGRGVEPIANGCLIMLASSLPGEGKTFVSVNLALSMARERDVSVLLVDADVAKPHISRLFGVDNEPGLLEALQYDSLEVESLILPTDIPNLSILPAGAPVDTATELLASQRMQSVVSGLSTGRSRPRVVIFDSPPLLLTSESRALAQPMGQVVLVVRAGVTPQQAVLDAIDCLGESKPVSLLLNQSESLSRTGYYYRDGAYGEYPNYADSRSADDPNSSAP